MTSDIEGLGSLIYLLLPLLLTSMACAASAASVYLGDGLLRAKAERGDKKATQIVKLLERGSRIETAVRMFTVVCLVISANAVGSLSLLSSIRIEYGGLLLVYPAVLVSVTLWAVVFYALAVETPRKLAAYFPDQTAYSLIGYLRLICTIMSPAVWLAGVLSSLAVRISGNDPLHTPHSVTEEEIRMLVDEGEERGTIEIEEKQMINNIFEFGDRDVSEVMTHRTEVAAVPVTATLQEVTSLSIETGYSRIPVFENDIDNICGIAYIKDLLKYMSGGNDESFSLIDELRRPLYVPESSSCSDVFALLKKEKTQIAVVVDEYGGTYGIVTMEDLLETIFGSIEDEYDNELPLVIPQADGSYLLDGSLGVSELEQLLDMRVPDDSDADTLGGFITQLLGGVPRNDDDQKSVAFGGVIFTVTQTDDRRISQLKAEEIKE